MEVWSHGIPRNLPRKFRLGRQSDIRTQTIKGYQQRTKSADSKESVMEKMSFLSQFTWKQSAISINFKFTLLSQVNIDNFFVHKIVKDIFLSISFNKIIRSSKEPSDWDDYFEYPQHMFWLRNKKIIVLVSTFNQMHVLWHLVVLVWSNV